VPQSKSQRRLIQLRDIDILTALARCPLTAEQLLKMSQTFQQPFKHERNVRRRLQDLGESGWVCSWQYATNSRTCGPKYYRITPATFRLLNGPDARLPRRRHFGEVAISRQAHTRALSDFIVHMLVAAHAADMTCDEFYRENLYEVSVGEESLLPDCAFALTTPAGKTFRFVVEIDCGTERLQSNKDVESIERKIRLYDAHQSQTDAFSPDRFVVLFVTTKNRSRLDHILDVAGSVINNPNRRLVCGVHLGDFLQSEEAIAESLFRDHRKTSLSLIPVTKITPNTESAQQPLPLVAAV
jgi:hypothetical protein